MAGLIIRPGWHLPERLVTPEAVFQERRAFLKQMALAGAGLALAGPAGRAAEPPLSTNSAPGRAAGKPVGRYPAKRDPDFNPALALTEESAAARFNNFYEFTTDKRQVHQLAQRLPASPWPIQIRGLVDKPLTIDAAELIDQMPLEERVYRFRCVEGWAMIVPWTGCPLRAVLERVAPKAEAKYVRFETFGPAAWAPGMAVKDYPWPYFEGLRLDEAMHPLTLLVSGAYGKPLAKQFGAPLRLIVPWKYGYKSIKSIVKIELLADQPKTFWGAVAPQEYPFESNVDPAVSHRRWSQATELPLGAAERVKTLAYNGYGDYVAKLYPQR